MKKGESPEPTAAHHDAGTSWSPAALVGFRFLFCYLVLFFFPFPSGLVNPWWLGSQLDWVWAFLVPRVFGGFIEIPDLNNGGSGDTTFDYLRVLCMLMLAGVATGVWTIVDRRRTDYRTLHAWARIWLRYALALCMLTFGSVKVLMIQFEPPGYGRLVQPLGELSPMAFLWTFMGFSASYTCFTGLMEVAGGLLLFFRRTTTLGALVVAGVMSNVVMLNVSYDVPVKIGSMHVLLGALVLLAPDLQRLLGFFVLNRATPPASMAPHLGRRWNTGAAMVKAVLICTLLVYLALDARRAYTQQAAARMGDPRAPEGWYRIVSMKRDGGEPRALTLDEGSWKTFSLLKGVVGLRAADGTVHRFKAEGDPTQGPVTLYPVNDKNEPVPGAAAAGTLTLSVSDGGEASLRGVFNGHEIEATMLSRNPADFPLMSRGFRWVSEAPYFR